MIDVRVAFNSLGLALWIAHSVSPSGGDSRLAHLIQRRGSDGCSEWAGQKQPGRDERPSGLMEVELDEHVLAAATWHNRFVVFCGATHNDELWVCSQDDGTLVRRRGDLLDIGKPR